MRPSTSEIAGQHFQRTEMEKIIGQRLGYCRTLQQRERFGKKRVRLLEPIHVGQRSSPLRERNAESFRIVEATVQLDRSFPRWQRLWRRRLHSDPNARARRAWSGTDVCASTRASAASSLWRPSRTSDSSAHSGPEPAASAMPIAMSPATPKAQSRAARTLSSSAPYRTRHSASDIASNRWPRARSGRGSAARARTRAPRIQPPRQAFPAHRHAWSRAIGSARLHLRSRRSPASAQRVVTARRSPRSHRRRGRMRPRKRLRA